MFAVAVDQLVNCPRGVRPRARRHSVSVCQVVGSPSNLALVIQYFSQWFLVIRVILEICIFGIWSRVCTHRGPFRLQSRRPPLLCKRSQSARHPLQPCQAPPTCPTTPRTRRRPRRCSPRPPRRPPPTTPSTLHRCTHRSTRNSSIRWECLWWHFYLYIFMPQIKPTLIVLSLDKDKKTAGRSISWHFGPAIKR